MSQFGAATILTVFRIVGVATGLFALSAEAQETWRLTSPLRIGAEDQPNYAFGNVRSLVADESGSVFVLDASRYGVSIFNSSGQFVRRFGRQGSGPGEFRIASSLGVRGDSIWVSDAALRRITFFFANWGSAEDDHSFTCATNPFHGAGVAEVLLANGTGLGVPPAAMGGRPIPDDVRTPLLQVGHDGTVIDTLFLFPYVTHALLLGTGTVLIFNPYIDVPLWAADATGTSVATVFRPTSAQPPIRVEFIPGTRQQYSGGGFVVAQLLITEATARPFSEAADELVLGRAGMVHSTFEQPLPAILESRAASGHDDRGRVFPGRWRIHPEQSAAGLWTTPSDLARLIVAIQNAAAGERTGLLSQAAAEEMLETQMGPSGLGFVVLGGGEHRIFRHGGANVGFRAQRVGFVEEGRGAVVMTNGEGGMELTDEIIAIALPARMGGRVGL